MALATSLSDASVIELKDDFGGLLTVTEVATKPIAGQKPGTSGLRKKTAVFRDGHYLHNFVQSVGRFAVLNYFLFPATQHVTC
jgi:phosphoglucomutase